MKDPLAEPPMIDVALNRIVIREGSEQQYIFLRELAGNRGFPIVIGTSEACEIRRVVQGIQPERPLTHQLAYESIKALGAELKRVDIVDLRNNTFFAQLVLQDERGERTAIVDARPSDAVALALRADCPMRVAESVLEAVRTDTSGPDPDPGADPAAEE
ncbi:MAG: bifunctional nuclease family protein [Planctomycetes bacterium]|nr:bifunctional nuclease family protein [Planctomycetota bacterium]